MGFGLVVLSKLLTCHSDGETTWPDREVTEDNVVLRLPRRRQSISNLLPAKANRIALAGNQTVCDLEAFLLQLPVALINRLDSLEWCLLAVTCSSLVWRSVAQRNMIQHGMIRFCMVWEFKVRYATVVVRSCSASSSNSIQQLCPGSF